MIKLYNQDILRVDFDCPKFNLVITSPPYNVGICHSEDTEILTLNGWKNYSELKSKELVASVNPKTFKIEYHPIEKIIVMDYNGKMINIQKSRSAVDILVSPNHRCFAKKRTRWKDDLHQWEFIHAKDLLKNYSHKFLCGGLRWNGKSPQTFHIDNKKINMELWVEFLGYFISEGHTCSSQKGQHVISITQKKGDKCDRIEACLKQLPWNLSIYSDKKTYKKFIITNKSLYNWLNKNIKKYGNDKIIPNDIKCLNTKYLKIFLTAYLLGDGNKSLPNSHSYYTSSKNIADSIQELELKIGNVVKIDKDIRNGKLLGYYLYCKIANDKKNYLTPIISRSDIKHVNYRGKIWCIQIKNHLFITRRNGKIGIHGNSYDNHKDTMTYGGYLRWCKKWIEKVANHMEDDGRICINIPFSVTPQHLNETDGAEDINYPVLSDYTQICAQIGLKYWRTVVWDKNLSNKTCWGSWREATSPFMRDPSEAILICYKGPWKRQTRGTSTITGPEFMLYTKNVWKIHPETNSDHPAAFPLDLPNRCIKLLSFKDDWIFDPFMGSGTTGEAASRLNRNFAGVELSPDYFKMAQQRIEDAAFQTQARHGFFPDGDEEVENA